MNIDVVRKKLRLGLIYGLVSSLAFAIFAWGLDALLLARANATFFWIKFFPGLIICTLSGGLIGWLTILFNKHPIAILLWGLLAGLYSWLVVWLPFFGSPTLIKIFEPSLANLYDFRSMENLYQFGIFSMIIVGFLAIVCGLLEISLIQQALNSSYLFTSIAPLLVCLVLFSLAGSAADQLVNTNLREPVQVVNNMIQFAADNEAVEVPRQIAREMHLSATNQLGELMQKHRQLTLIRFDEDFVFMDTLVDFEGILVRCTTISAQPTDCIILTSNP
jgi:hypothetical protein